VSEDGTRKYLVRIAGRSVRSRLVLSPEEGRGTLCVSSPGLGVPLNVVPSATQVAQKLVRKPTAAGDHGGQRDVARDDLGE